MSIANKLTYLNDTREKIRTRLNRLGAGILPNDTFRSYADAIEDVYDSMPKVEQDDVESATLDGTIEGGLQIDLKSSDNTQRSLTGKNMLNFVLPFNVSGEQNKFITPVPQLEVGQKYYFVGKCSDGTTLSASNCVFVWYNSTTSQAVKMVNANITYTAEDLSSANSFYIYLGGNLAGKTITECMLVKGTYDSSNIPPYEPYCGGIPSPNPDYPQPVNVVSGDNTINVNCRNLLDTNKMVTFQPPVANRWYWLDGIIASSPATLYCEVQAGQSYTFSIYKKTNVIKTQGLYVINGVESQAFIIDGDNTSTTFTPNTTTNLYIRVNVSTANIDTYCIGQLEKGSTATEFQPTTSYPVNLPVENLLAHDLATIKTLNTGGTWSDNVYTQNSLNFTINNDGSVRVNGTASANTYLTYPTFTLKAGTYTLGAGIYINTLTRIQLVEDISGRPIIASTGNGASSTFTTSADKSVFLQWRINSGEVIDKVFYPMLEKGSKANSFSPYGTTPIELCKIGDYQEYFTKNSGKNLFNKDNITDNKAYDGNVNSSISIGTNNATFIGEKIVVSSNQIIISSNKTNATFRVRLTDDNDIVKYNQGFTTMPQTIDTSTYKNVYIFYDKSTITKDDNIQIEAGDTKTTYEPYGTGLWCKYNAIGKVDLSSLTWEKQMDLSGNYKLWYTTDITNIKYASVNTELINNYSEKYIKDSATGMSGTNKRNHLAIDTRAVRVQAVDSPTGLFYYPLATPYLSLIEDNNLIEQLNELEAAKSKAGQTNVSQINNDRPFILDVKAILDWRN